MDAAPLPSQRVPASRLSVARLIAFVGLLAVAAGWFLPWVGNADLMGTGRSEVDELVEPRGSSTVPDPVRSIARRLQAGEGVSGSELATVGRFLLSRRTDLDARERRAWTAGFTFVRWIPFIALGVAGLLLVGRMRGRGAVVLSLVLTVSMLTVGFLGLLLVGASPSARDAVQNDPGVLGIGLYTLLLGHVLTLFGCLFAMRSSWWKVFLLSGATLAGVVLICARYVGPA